MDREQKRKSSSRMPSGIAAFDEIATAAFPAAALRWCLVAPGPVRELVLTNEGVSLADVYAAGGEVLMGTLRWEKENEERRLRVAARNEAELLERRAVLTLARTSAQMATLAHEQAIQEAELRQMKERVAAENHSRGIDGNQLLQRRCADPPTTSTPPSADVGKRGKS